MLVGGLCRLRSVGAAQRPVWINSGWPGAVVVDAEGAS